MRAGALCALCFAGVLALGFVGIPTPAHSGPKEDLRALREKVERLTRELAAAESSKSDATDALRESERAISQSSRRLHELQAEQEQVRARIAELEAEQARLGITAREQQQRLARTLRNAYLYGSTDTVALLLAPGDPNQTARRLRYLGYVYRDRAAAIGRLRQDRTQIEALAAESRRQSEALAALEGEQTGAQQALLRQRGERAAALARMSAQIDRQRREMDALKRDEERLGKLVQKLAKQLAARPSKKKPARPAGNAGREKPGALAALPRQDAPVASPLSGELAARFGSPRSGTGLRWNGWFIAAARGSPVKAPASGRVVFADWLRGFGNLLILDHGEGLMSLYGNNEALLKSVGEDVRRGEHIAAVGNSGGNADSGLYFEVRFQGKPVDPAHWIGAR